MGPHLYKVQIEDQDIDPIYGVVSYIAPRRWNREADEEWFRSKGLDLATLRMHGCLFVPSQEQTRWSGKPILPSDEPTIETIMDSIRDLVDIREARRYSEMRLVHKLKVRDEPRVASDIILVYLQDKKKAVMPNGIRSKLES